MHAHLGSDVHRVELHLYEPVLDDGVREADGGHVVEDRAGEQVLVRDRDRLAAIGCRDVDPEDACNGTDGAGEGMLTQKTPAMGRTEQGRGC